MEGASRRTLLVFSPECDGYKNINYWGGMGQVVHNVTKWIGDGYRTFVFTRTDSDEPVIHRPSESLTVIGLKPYPPPGGSHRPDLGPGDRDSAEASYHWNRVADYMKDGDGEFGSGANGDGAVAWYNDWFSVFPMRALYERGVRGVMTYHMSHSRPDRSDPRLWTEGWGADHIRGSSCMGSAVSKVQKGIIQRAYGLPDDKVAVIPNGVDTTIFNPAARGNAGVLGKYGIRKPYVLFCGRPVREKGPDTVLRALPNLARERPDIKAVLMFLGRPEHHGNREFWGTYDSGWFGPYRDKVIFPRREGMDIGGYIPDDERAAIFANAEASILPSNPAIAPEAFGLTSTESQACGVPVVVGDWTGMVGTTEPGRTGIAVDPSSPEKVAAAALECMGRPEMGREARKLMEDRFRWDGVADAYRRLFDTL